MIANRVTLSDFLVKYPAPPEETVPSTPSNSDGSEGPYTYENTEARLQAWADAHPEFTFERGRTSKGPGFYIRCPGDTIGGWPDGATHGDVAGSHNPSMAVWVADGLARFSCRHAHCSEGALQGKKTWKHLQLFFDPGEKLYSLKGHATVGEVSKTPPPAKSVIKEQPEVAAAEWFFDADDFLKEKLPPRRVLASDNNGTPFLFEKSLNQVFAFRGQGKTMFTHGLVNILVHGGEFLRYKSHGGAKVLIADGELPDIQLQERVQKLIGPSGGLLKLMSPDRMPNQVFPTLSNPEWQDEFLKRADEWKPDVIVFDTLTACFRFDTNDPDIWLNVNQFFISLRMKGYCIIIVHHAGKSGTQRGRTDGDDNLDLSIKLDAPKGWAPGDGLELIVSYEKVRAGGNLPGFQAVYCDASGKWDIAVDVEGNEAVKLMLQGKSVRGVAISLDIDKNKVHRIKKQAEKAGIVFPPVKSGRKKDAEDED